MLENVIKYKTTYDQVSSVKVTLSHNFKDQKLCVEKLSLWLFPFCLSFSFDCLLLSM